MSAVSGVGSPSSYVPPANTPPVSAGRDADGDNDGTKAVATPAPVNQLATSGSVGTIINTTA